MKNDQIFNGISTIKKNFSIYDGVVLKMYRTHNLVLYTYLLQFSTVKYYQQVFDIQIKICVDNVIK